ncbi:MAG TPA: hypothetical protein VIL46_13600 [Gemmataceae bacterium]
MQKISCRNSVLDHEAVIHRVDTVNRELTALVGTVLVKVYVPPDCAVVLRGEPVKLRMVQAGDRVRLRYAARDGSLVAQRLEVHSGTFPAARRE